jgi:hypothetical protein
MQRVQPAAPWEVAALLGHKIPGYSITEMYAGADPGHKGRTRHAVACRLRAAWFSQVGAGEGI